MIQVQRSYADITAIIAGNNQYFDYDDDWYNAKTGWESLDGATEGQRTITTIRNSSVQYVCSIPLIDTENPAYGTGVYTDQKDFDDNWQSKAGDKAYVHESFSNQFAADSVSEWLWQLKDSDDVGPVEAFIYGASIDYKGSVWGRHFKGEIVVKDGGGAGVHIPVGTLIKKHICLDGANSLDINPPHYDYVRSKKKVDFSANNLHLCIQFDNTGNVDPVDMVVTVSYEY